jgi:molybdopterin molybdotransferase
MLTVDEARDAIRKRCAALPAQRRRLAAALDCVLAEEVSADLDLPPFDKALVDGYAVRSADLNGAGDDRRLMVVEEITAGRMPTRPLGAREAAAIMTGAPLPAGADAVVMIEKTRREGDTVIIDDPAVGPGKARLPRGRELRAGDVVLRRGQRLSPPRLGLLASVGRTEVLVVPRPRVMIVPTGDELVEAHQVPGPGQIRNSNAVMLQAFAAAAGAEAQALPIAPDDPERLTTALAQGLEADVLQITGGVSAGKLDLVPATLERLGVTRVFHKVRLKPGKPLWFGVGPMRQAAPGTLVFGLPGNPVSGVVGFLLFVRPALKTLAGQDEDAGASARCVVPEACAFPLAAPFVHEGDRPTYHPARLVSEGGQAWVVLLAWAGSADLKTVAAADGFAIFAAGERTYQKGEIVGFLPLG